MGSDLHRPLWAVRLDLESHIRNESPAQTALGKNLTQETAVSSGLCHRLAACKRLAQVSSRCAAWPGLLSQAAELMSAGPAHL